MSPHEHVSQSDAHFLHMTGYMPVPSILYHYGTIIFRHNLEQGHARVTITMRV